MVLIPPARHGRALALYGLKRYAEARDEWVALLASNPPRPLAERGDVLAGRYARPSRATKKAPSRGSRRSPPAARQPLTENALLSLGWWSRAAGQPADAVKAYRRSCRPTRSRPRAPWARAGLVQALLDQNDFAAAREEAQAARGVEQDEPAGAADAAEPAPLGGGQGQGRGGTGARHRSPGADARAGDPGLGAAPERRARAASGQCRGGARPPRARPLDARQRRPPSCSRPSCDWPRSTSTRASTRRPRRPPRPCSTSRSPTTCAPRRCSSSAESAYWARNWDQAAASYSRFVSDFPKRPEAPAAGFALGWAEFRRGRLDAARERWAAFAREAPADPRAGEALLLAAELAAKAGDRAQARAMLDRVVGQYPGTEQAEVARLNRAILSLNAGPRDRCPGRAEPGRPGRLAVVSLPRPRARGQGLGPRREQAARGGASRS